MSHLNLKNNHVNLNITMLKGITKYVCEGRPIYLLFCFFCCSVAQTVLKCAVLLPESLDVTPLRQGLDLVHCHIPCLEKWHTCSCIFYICIE